MENIDTIIDLLNSENREDFELGVNIIEALEERPVINPTLLNQEFEYAVIGERLRRRRLSFTFDQGGSTWTYRYFPGESNKSWEED